MKNIRAFQFGSLACILFSVTTACSAGVTKKNEAMDSNTNSSVQAQVIVDINKKGPVIDSSFYGSHLDSFAPFPNSNLVKELGISQLRIGGNEYDVFNYTLNMAYTKTGIYNIAGFSSVETWLKNNNLKGIYQINLHGYQPVLEGNSVLLKNSFTAQNAYEMIKRLNGQLRLGIVNFSLGNEPEQWHETHPHTGEYNEESGISADDYIQKYIDFALAIRKAQEEVNGNPNSIKIWGPEISSSWLDWNTGNFTQDCNWHHTIRGQVECSYGNGQFTHFIPYFLHRLTKAESDRTINPRGYKLLDYFAFHYYPNFRTDINDINSIVKNEKGVQHVAKILESTRVLNDPNFKNTVDVSSYKNVAPNIIGRMKGWVKSYYPNAKLAINEFAVDSDWRSTTYHPIIRPLYLADTLGIAAKEGISFFNNFILSNSEGSRIPWSLIENGNSKSDLYNMYSLFTQHFKGTILAVEDNQGDLVNGYAVDQGKNVALVLVNKSPIDKSIQVFLKDGSSKKVATYTMPGWSASVLKIEKNTWFKRDYEVYRFGADEMGITKDINYLK